MLLPGKLAPKPHSAPVFSLVCSSRIRGMITRGGELGPGGPIREKTIVFVARSKAVPLAAINQKSTQREKCTCPPSFIRHPPASVHSECNELRKGSLAASASRSAPNTRRKAHMSPCPSVSALH